MTKRDIINDEYPVRERDHGGCEDRHSCESKQKTNNNDNINDIMKNEKHTT